MKSSQSAFDYKTCRSSLRFLVMMRTFIFVRLGDFNCFRAHVQRCASTSFVSASQRRLRNSNEAALSANDAEKRVCCCVATARDHRRNAAAARRLRVGVVVVAAASRAARVLDAHALLVSAPLSVCAPAVDDFAPSFCSHVTILVFVNVAKRRFDAQKWFSSILMFRFAFRLRRLSIERNCRIRRSSCSRR